MTIWAPGMLCVCIRNPTDRARAAIPPGNWPNKGTVYMIREVRDDRKPDGHLTLLLREIDNSHLLGLTFSGGTAHLEPGFPEYGFRPLSEDSLDQFREHLNRIPADGVLA